MLSTRGGKMPRSNRVLMMAWLYGLEGLPWPHLGKPQPNKKSETPRLRSGRPHCGDSDASAALMTDEYLQTDISGRVQDKRTWFTEYFNPLAALIKAGKFHWSLYDRKDIRIQIYGECAVVMGELALEQSLGRLYIGVDRIKTRPCLLIHQAEGGSP